MSNRSLLEFNHDYAHRIDEWRERFFKALMYYLSTGDAKNADLDYFGIEVVNMRHHSEERKLP